MSQQLEYLNQDNVFISPIPLKVKRVIFKLTHGFIGKCTFRYTDLKAEDILRKL